MESFWHIYSAQEESGRLDMLEELLANDVELESKNEPVFKSL